MHNYTKFNMSGMQKSAANKLLQKRNCIPMPMLYKRNIPMPMKGFNYMPLYFISSREWVGALQAVMNSTAKIWVDTKPHYSFAPERSNTPSKWWVAFLSPTSPSSSFSPSLLSLPHL